jgi:hypothetical protein
VLTDGPTRQPWGVEVTEMFRSESEARAIHHPDYLTRLFKGGQHMHRDDKITLSVETVIVHHEDGTQQSMQSVVAPGEPIQIRYERLADVIRTKATRPYQSDLRHISLIIRDRYDLMGDKRERYWVSTLMECGVREALLASPFHEVYWITVIEETREQVCRPLRLLMMLEQCWLFGYGLDTWHPNPDDLTPQDAVLLFANCCTRSGIEVRLWFMHDKLWVLHKGVAIGLGEKGIEILHNHDYAVPDDQIRPRSAGDPLLTDEQFASASAYVNSNGFSAEYYDRVATPANLRYPTMTGVRLKLSEITERSLRSPRQPSDGRS